MPSRLKSLELHGYKTFASRTLFEFAGKVTAIVGPNGSGKSNIADSMRWVLGEQSYSLLRGKRTEDMIFSGSEQRTRAGMASATVVFDNSDGWLPIDFSEVAVARRAYRDGNNEYLINGQRVRLKDVTELLAQSGLAERTYTIIGQGVVDAALALKAEERRRLFEEAAGIGLYRSRREEALRRLETTRRNLDRVQDILAELQPRLRSLERQARRTQEYEQVRTDLTVLLHEWYGYHWHHAQQELSESREFSRKQESALELARKAVVEMDEKLVTARNQIHGLRSRLNSWHRQLAQLHTHQESLGRQLAVAGERRRSLEAQQIELQGEQARLAEEVDIQAERLAGAKSEAGSLGDEQLEASSHLAAAQAALAGRQAEREAAELSVKDARQELSQLNDQQVQIQARLSERQAGIERLIQARQLAEQSASDAENNLQTERAKEQAALKALQQIVEQRNRAELAVQDRRQLVEELESSLKELQQKRDTQRAETARLNAQAEVLDQAEADLAGYARGAQLLLTAARQSRLKASSSSLGVQLDVPLEIETAIAAALGEYLDGILVNSADGVDAALDLLTGQSARGVVLPMDHLAPPPSAWHKYSSTDGVVGLASDLVNCPPELRPAVDLLLGSTLVVHDRQAARRALAALDQPASAHLRAVTLAGEVFHASGPVLTGQEGKSSTLSRSRQRRELQEELSKLASRSERLEKDLSQAAARLAAARDELEKAGQDLKAQLADEAEAQTTHRNQVAALEKAEREAAWQSEQIQRIHQEAQTGQAQVQSYNLELSELEQRIAAARQQLQIHSRELAELALDELQEQVSYWYTRSAVTDRAVADAESRCLERQAALERTQELLAAVDARLDETQQALHSLEEEKNEQRQEESQVSEQIAALRVLIDPAEAELDESEAAQEVIQNSENTARRALSKAENQNAQARIGFARHQEAVETWRRRIEDDFGLVAFEYDEEVSGPNPLPLQGLVEQLPRVDRLAPDVEDHVRRLRAQLRRMGPVNPEAQTEYHEVKQRFQFMTDQVADLTKAEADVRQAISELDALMERELRKTFDAVAGEFSEIFKRLFGGGSARLLLTDPDDMTNTGIDIEARLPGRRSQGLSLLSGGERSLTAVSLIFALLRISPTPFCVLDEVDAMLDEANVGRFRDLLRELSQHTQFIIVTHNRNTVQVAEVIYGITMGRDSSSQVISLKLDEVPVLAE